MSLGVVCHYLDSTFKNILGHKKLRKGDFDIGKYSNQHITDVYCNNVNAQTRIIEKLHSEGITCYRMSSELLPLLDIVDESVKHDATVAKCLRHCGDVIMKLGVRVIFHPDQFCVLSSDSESVVDNAVTVIDDHAWIVDMMGLSATQYFPINIHGGKSGRSDRLINTIVDRLSCSARSRLTLENDEFSYSIEDLLPVSKSTGVPICLDSHHHNLNPGSLSIDDAFYAACETWPAGIRPVQHLSNSRDEVSEEASVSKRRAHSDYIKKIPQIQLEHNNYGLIDVEVEAKMKNFAVYKLHTDFGALLTT